jgi:hypothetical protein
MCYSVCDNSGRLVLRDSIKVFPLLLIFATGCFGSRSRSIEKSDSGPSVLLDSGLENSGKSDSKNRDGSIAPSDGRTYPDRQNDTNGFHCGDNFKEEFEVCDGTDLGGQTCRSIAGPGVIGSLLCAPDCESFDTSLCYPHTSTVTDASLVDSGPDTHSTDDDDSGVR